MLLALGPLLCAERLRVSLLGVGLFSFVGPRSRRDIQRSENSFSFSSFYWFLAFLFLSPFLPPPFLFLSFFINLVLFGLFSFVGSRSRQDPQRTANFFLFFFSLVLSLFLPRPPSFFSLSFSFFLPYGSPAGVPRNPD